MSTKALSYAILLHVVLLTGGAGQAVAEQEFINSLEMQMVLVRPSKFVSGTMMDRSNWQWYEAESRHERPRWVELSEPFYLSAHEVTNAQYREFVRETSRPEPKGLLLRGREMVWGFEPWKDPDFNKDDQPVVCVTANVTAKYRDHPEEADAEAFCRWLSKKEGRQYSLPTPDEWEYACRAGAGTAYNWGSDEVDLTMANYDPFLVEYPFTGEPVMLPLAESVQSRGGTVRWRVEGKRATGEVGAKSFEVSADSTAARVDGKRVQLEAAAAVVGGKLVVPASFLANDLDLVFTGRPMAVGSFKPNAWGFYDMHGNVNEIVAGAISAGSFREVRGGGWNDSARRCRSASRRGRWKCTQGMAGIGFRVRCLAPVESKVKVEIDKPVVVRSDWVAATELLQLRDGSLIIQDRRSNDGGKTWQPCPQLPSQPAIELQNGSIVSISRPSPDPEKGSGWGKGQGLISTDGWQTVAPFEFTMHIPEAIGGFNDAGRYSDGLGVCDHGILQLPNGDILLTMYGFFRKARVLQDYQRYPAETQQWKYVSWLVKSSDGGKTWSYLSTIIYHPELTRGGACEEGMVRLADGSLLVGARTGEEGFPNEHMLFTWSKDDGRTWSYPKALFVDNKPILGIYPQFVLMKSGILAMVWGRTGYGPMCLAFSVDGRGEQWSDLTRLPFGKGGYNDMVEVEPGTLLITGRKARKVGGLTVLPVKVTLK